VGNPISILALGPMTANILLGVLAQRMPGNAFWSGNAKRLENRRTALSVGKRYIQRLYRPVAGTLEKCKPASPRISFKLQSGLLAEGF